MSLKTFLVSRVAARITGQEAQNARRAKAEAARRAAGGPHLVEYFHQADDPYAQLAVAGARALAARYRITLKPQLVSAPPDWAAPERAMLIAYARRDAALLARRAGLAFADPGAQPGADLVAAAEAALAASLSTGRFLDEAEAIGAALWAGAAPPGARADAAPLKTEGDGRREALGHYLGATFHYGGEWYWGLDRLHYLEERLAGLGLRQPDAPPAPFYPPQPVPAGRAPAGFKPRHRLEYFLSFRSPYTYIAAARAKALADAYGCELQLRYVLPMMMRGLPVPASKRGYITMDVAREARRLGVAFGKIADPLGKPVERGYALFPRAIAAGRGFAYAESFLAGVWSQGIDAGSDAGLRAIAERAGLDWADARNELTSDAWRAEAEANRQAMMAAGLWGVPSFRYGETAIWGQDRLWVIEEALRAECA